MIEVTPLYLMVCGKLGGGTKSKHENQRVKFDVTTRKDGRQTKSPSPRGGQVGHIRVETDSDSLVDYDRRAIPGNPSNPESKVKMRSIP